MSYESIKNAADFIREKCGEAKIGLVLGSGLADSITLENPVSVNYNDIPNFPVSTVEGHVSEWVAGTLGGKKVFMMRGRFHYYEGYSLEDVVLPIRVMKLLGVKTIILTNAAGGVNTDFKPGDLMLINDHINYSGINPLIGKNYNEFGTRFPDVSNAYTKELRPIAHSCADELGITLRDGNYIWFSGPSYETPAEIRMARMLGADAVGMSTVPEVIVAAHSGIKVIGISCISNMAAGILDKPLSHEEVSETSHKVVNDFAKLINKIVEKI